MAQRRSGAVLGSAAPLWTQQPQPQPPPARLWLRLLPLFVIPFIVLGGFVLYAELKYRPASKPNPPGQTGVLVWGNGVFVSKGEISGWLRLHGGTFKTWKVRHPAALRLVSPAKPRRHATAAAAAAPKRAHVRPKTRTAAKHRPVAGKRAVPKTRTSQSRAAAPSGPPQAADRVAYGSSDSTPFAVALAGAAALAALAGGMIVRALLARRRKRDDRGAYRPRPLTDRFADRLFNARQAASRQSSALRARARIGRLGNGPRPAGRATTPSRNGSHAGGVGARRTDLVAAPEAGAASARAPHSTREAAESASAATAPPAPPMPTEAVSDVERMQSPGEDMVAAVLARAQRDRTAVSLVVVRASAPDAHELLAAIADAAPEGAGEAVDAPGTGRLMMLSGVLPKRACTLAQAAVAASGRNSGADGIAVGIAGYPRHAHSAIELVGAAEAAAEKAAASRNGDRVVIAADAP